MLEPSSALILFFPVLVIAVWVTLTDFRQLRIPNKAVLAMAAIWPLFGWLLVPLWSTWLWGLALMAIVLVVGFLFNQIGGFGAGDAKYAASIAGFFAGSDIVVDLVVFLICLIATTVLYYLLAFTPAVRRMVPDWKCWTTRRYIPFGFALSTIVVLYLMAAMAPKLSIPLISQLAAAIWPQV